MLIQISFTYNNVNYKYTIDEHYIDTTHYDDLWDAWFGENENELADKNYINKPDDGQLLFEITAHKRWVESKNDYIISGEGLYINVYENTYEDDYCDQIENVEVLYM